MVPSTGVPLGNVPVVDFPTASGNDVGFGVDTGVFVAEVIDDDTSIAVFVVEADNDDAVVFVLWSVILLLPRLVRRRKRMFPCSSFMVPVDCHSGSSLESQAGTTPSQPDGAFLDRKSVV